MFLCVKASVYRSLAEVLENLPVSFELLDVLSEFRQVKQSLTYVTIFN